MTTIAEILLAQNRERPNSALGYDRNTGNAERRWRFVDLEIDPLHKACVVHAGAPGDVTVREHPHCAVRSPGQDLLST